MNTDQRFDRAFLKWTCYKSFAELLNERYRRLRETERHKNGPWIEKILNGKTIKIVDAGQA